VPAQDSDRGRDEGRGEGRPGPPLGSGRRGRRANRGEHRTGDPDPRLRSADLPGRDLHHEEGRKRGVSMADEEPKVAKKVKKTAEKEEPEEEKPLRKKPKKPKEKEEAEERVHEARANPNWTTASSNSWRCVPRRTPLGRSSGAKNGSGTACSETNGGSRREANRSCGATSATDGISRRLGTAGRGRSEGCTRADSRRSSCTTRGSSRASMQRNRRCGLRTVSAPGSGRSSRKLVTTRACASSIGW